MCLSVFCTTARKNKIIKEYDRSFWCHMLLTNLLLLLHHLVSVCVSVSVCVRCVCVCVCPVLATYITSYSSSVGDMANVLEGGVAVTGFTSTVPPPQQCAGGGRAGGRIQTNYGLVRRLLLALVLCVQAGIFCATR